jgi:hypothetical protein
MNYFLVNFIDFFIFLIQIQIWIFGPVATAGYRYRTPAVAARLPTVKKTLEVTTLSPATNVWMKFFFFRMTACLWKEVLASPSFK